MTSPLAEQFMREAIKLAHYGMTHYEGGPFGAVVVKEDQIIGRGWNQVISLQDPTAHAEIQAIRQACHTLQSFTLANCEIYTSCEPCPMCLSAIYWARIDRIYYAGTHEEAQQAGFDDALILKECAKPLTQRKIHEQQLLHTEVLSLFETWKQLPAKIHY